MITTPYMGLIAWNSVTDEWDHEQLADNFRKLDEHDHASGKGRQIPTGGIEDGAITKAKLSPDTLFIEDGSIDTRHLRDLAVTTPKIAFNAVNDSKIASSAVTTRHIANGNIYSYHMNPKLQQAIGLGYRKVTRFTPSGTSRVGEHAKAPRYNGESNSLKIDIPPWGGVLNFFAEGDFNINNAESPRVSDLVSIRAWIELNIYPQVWTIPIYHGRALNLTADRYATWSSVSGTDWHPDHWIRIRSRLSNEDSSIAGSNYTHTSGGPVSKFIATGGGAVTAYAKLILWVDSYWGSEMANRKGPPHVEFHTQTLTAWSTAVDTEGA